MDNDSFLDIVNRLGRIEGNLDFHKSSLERIEKNLQDVRPVHAKVHQHDVMFKGIFAFIGVTLSYYIGKLLGKF